MSIINTITENLPVVGTVVGALAVAVVAILRAVAKKKGEENTKLDEVADAIEDVADQVDNIIGKDEG